MIRFLNVAAVLGLIASALYAYSIKYETTLQIEQVAKLQRQIGKEQDAIAGLRADWQSLNRPERLQALSAQHLELMPLSVPQIIASPAEIPRRVVEVDAIGRKLEALGLGQPTATPVDRAPAPRTPDGGRRP